MQVERLIPLQQANNENEHLTKWDLLIKKTYYYLIIL